MDRIMAVARRHGLKVIEDVSHAQALLLGTEMKVADVSFEVGYKTVANFNKYFKQITGVTPSAYRNARRRIGAT